MVFSHSTPSATAPRAGAGGMAGHPSACYGLGTMSESEAPAIPHPAATVVLLRGRGDACEVLLVRRSKKLSFHGGAWVFPGGRIDDSDYAASGEGDVLAAARSAAVREVREETGLEIEGGALVTISRWITPVVLAKRFDTWFFAGRAGEEEVQVDGGEIREHRWLAPSDALAAQRRGEIELPPPTFVTLSDLARFSDPGEALQQMARRAMRTFTPRICMVEGGACSLYEGDAGYEHDDPERPGARHRLWLNAPQWRYERTGLRNED
jgi:8-oxo-dGTP pyrophosphatase MutT (NUDIX family)